MANETTAHLHLPLPHPENLLENDVERLREAFGLLDACAAAVSAALATQRETSAAQQATLERQEASLTRVAEIADEATQGIRTEAAARQTADAGHDATLAALTARLDALAAQVADIKVDPWDVFPPRVPIAVDGVTFPTGENARHPIMPGETTPRLDWLICDGGADGKGGSVPDLRGRMILGASDARPSGSVGGSETHAHSVSGTVGYTTLSVEQMPSHTHTGNIFMAVSSGGVTTNPRDTYQWGPVIGYAGGSQAHTHPLSGSSAGASSLPPFHALSLIMRIA